MKTIYWNKNEVELGVIGTETVLKDSFGKQLYVGDIVECKLKNPKHVSMGHHCVVVVISEETKHPCLWGFAAKTETPDRYKKFLEEWLIELEKSHLEITGDESEFRNLNIQQGT